METTEILNETIHELFTQAARDGIITDYERQIITQVETDVKAYLESLELAMEDGIIDEDENIKLKKLILEINNNANEIALSDGILSRNEKDLLLKLRKLIQRAITI